MVSLEVSLDAGHEDIIHDAQLDFFGRHLATCSSDSTVKIFEINNDVEKELKQLKEHQGPVWQVSWCHPQFGNILASCGYDKRVVFYSGKDNWNKINEYSCHDSSVNGISWAPPEYGPVIASCSSDETIAIVTIMPNNTFDFKKIPKAHSIGVNAISWAPVLLQDSQLIKRICSGGLDTDVKIFRCTTSDSSSLSEWQLDSTLHGHTDWVLDVAWRPYVLSREDMIASCDRVGMVLVWTRPAGSQQQDWTQTKVGNFNQPVWHLSWSSTGDILAVSFGENNVILFRQNLEKHWCKISDVNHNDDAL